MINFEVYEIRKLKQILKILKIDSLKFVSAFFIVFIFSPNDSPSKTEKMFFISSKNLF